jgi:hypothetical protein
MGSVPKGLSFIVAGKREFPLLHSGKTGCRAYHLPVGTSGFFLCGRVARV